MFKVYFKYVDGNEIACENINKIEVETADGYEMIPAEKILNYRFNPQGAIHLYADAAANYTVSSDGLRYMSIRVK